MIYKELDPFQSNDKFAKTGRAAEEQMAFYFKRFFCDDSDILVLNGIRIGHNEMIRKEGLRFFRECDECNSSPLHF